MSCPPKEAIDIRRHLTRNADNKQKTVKMIEACSLLPYSSTISQLIKCSKLLKIAMKGDEKVKGHLPIFPNNFFLNKQISIRNINILYFKSNLGKNQW
jgi:hypothetical protein